MFVALPTIVVFVIGNLYEMFVIYQKSGLFTKTDSNFTTTQVGYSMSNSNLVTT
jgi:hypothetical protein